MEKHTSSSKDIFSLLWPRLLLFIFTTETTVLHPLQFTTYRHLRTFKCCSQSRYFKSINVKDAVSLMFFFPPRFEAPLRRNKSSMLAWHALAPVDEDMRAALFSGSYQVNSGTAGLAPLNWQTSQTPDSLCLRIRQVILFFPLIAPLCYDG